MDSLAVHDILSTNIYRIKTPEISILSGQEVLNSLQCSIQCGNPIVTLDPAVIYKYQIPGDSLLVSGQQILDAFPIKECESYFSVMGWGALAFGIVIGWNLYFVNRYRDRTSVGLTDITAVLSAVAGVVLMTFFNDSQRLIGAYGIGLAIGFLLYFIMLVILSLFSKDPALKFPDYFLKLHDGHTPMLVNKRSNKEEDE